MFRELGGGHWSVPASGCAGEILASASAPKGWKAQHANEWYARTDAVGGGCADTSVSCLLCLATASGTPRGSRRACAMAATLVLTVPCVSVPAATTHKRGAMKAFRINRRSRSRHLAPSEVICSCSLAPAAFRFGTRATTGPCTGSRASTTYSLPMRQHTMDLRSSAECAMPSSRSLSMQSTIFPYQLRQRSIQPQKQS